MKAQPEALELLQNAFSGGRGSAGEGLGGGVSRSEGGGVFGASSVEELVECAVAREAANVPALVMLAGGVDLKRPLIEH
jgi:hypothetical protein